MGFGRHVGGGDDVLCGLIFLWMEGERERGRDVCVSARGERWGEVFMGSVSLPARWDKGSLVKLSKSPDAEYVRNQRTLSLSYLPLYLKGLMDVKPCVQNCDRVKFMN